MDSSMFNDIWKGFILLLIIAAILGWIIIEGILWLIRNISITIG